MRFYDAPPHLPAPEIRSAQIRQSPTCYDTFDYFLTATDDSLGYPPDGNRLVQRWCWFSLADTRYPTGNLFDPTTRQITPLRDAFGRYVVSLR